MAEKEGYQCLPVLSVLLAERRAADAYLFVVELEADGGPFVLGPCCDGDISEFPPESQFPFLVQRDDQGRFRVQDLPVYVP